MKNFCYVTLPDRNTRGHFELGKKSRSKLATVLVKALTYNLNGIIRAYEKRIRFILTGLFRFLTSVTLPDV